MICNCKPAAAAFYRLLSASDVPATDWARSQVDLVACPHRARPVVRQYEDSCVNAARSAAHPPAVDWAPGGRRLPSGSSAPDRMTSGKRAAAGGGPAERRRGGCRWRVRSGPAACAVPEADGILRFSRTSLASISASGAEAGAGRSAQCDHQRPCRPRRRGQSRCGRQRRFGAAREGTTHGSFVSDD